MAQVLQYDKNVLLNRLSSELGVSQEIAKSKATLIADSYSSARIYASDKKQAAQMIINGSKTAFGFEINQGILDTALQYVGKFEGNIASDEFINNAREQRNQPQALEAEVGRAYSGNVVPISDNRQAQNVYVPSFIRSRAARIAAGIAVGAMVLGYGSAYSRAQSAQPASGAQQPQAATASQPYVNLNDYGIHLQEYEALKQQVEAQSKRLDSLEKLAQSGAGQAQASISGQASQSVAAQGAGQQGTQAPPSSQAAGTPASQAPATTVSSAIDYAQQQTAYRWQYNQSTEEHDRFLRREVKYAGLTDRVKAWFSLRHPRTELSQDGSNYFLQVNPVTSYKSNDLADFKFGVKVGGKWFYGLAPNTDSKIQVPENVYTALQAQKNPASQVIFYKIDSSDPNKPVLVIHSSLNYDRSPSGIVGRRPAAPSKPAVEQPKIEQTKTEPPKVEADVGGIPFHPDHLTKR